MAETSQFGGGFNANFNVTCTVKKASNNNSASNVNVTHLKRKTRQSHRRNIHNRVCNFSLFSIISRMYIQIRPSDGITNNVFPDFFLS